MCDSLVFSYSLVLTFKRGENLDKPDLRRLWLASSVPYPGSASPGYLQKLGNLGNPSPHLKLEVIQPGSSHF